MDFPQFYKVIDSITTKQELPFQINEDNYSQYMVNRYLSFINPQSCIFVNDVFNDITSFPFESQDEKYRMMMTVFPKVGKKYIKYKKKTVSKKIEKSQIPDEDIDALASMLEVSKREIRDYISSLIEQE